LAFEPTYNLQRFFARVARDGGRVRRCSLHIGPGVQPLSHFPEAVLNEHPSSVWNLICDDWVDVASLGFYDRTQSLLLPIIIHKHNPAIVELRWWHSSTCWHNTPVSAYCVTQQKVLTTRDEMLEARWFRLRYPLSPTSNLITPWLWSATGVREEWSLVPALMSYCHLSAYVWETSPTLELKTDVPSVPPVPPVPPARKVLLRRKIVFSGDDDDVG